MMSLELCVNVSNDLYWRFIPTLCHALGAASGGAHLQGVVSTSNIGGQIRQGLVIGHVVLEERQLLVAACNTQLGTWGGCLLAV